MGKIKAYFELTKPRALLVIVFTTCASFMIAATDVYDFLLLAHTAIGVAIAAGGSLALNQHMERNLDKKMTRTKDRPIPSGRVQSGEAFAFGMITMIGGYLYLWFLVNPGCSIATLACGVSYLYMYTPLKLRSSFSSFVGAIPGGLLPIMGWVAARGRLEVGAWVLFVILFLWQIPHALIISMRYREDYESVGMRQLPLVSTPAASRKQIVLNVLVLVPVSLLPAMLNMTELAYPIAALCLGLVLFWQTTRYVMVGSEKNARAAFLALSLYLPLLLLAMYLDKPA